jgi:hypothetical protein
MLGPAFDPQTFLLNLSSTAFQNTTYRTHHLDVPMPRPNIRPWRSHAELLEVRKLLYPETEMTNPETLPKSQRLGVNIVSLRNSVSIYAFYVCACLQAAGILPSLSHSFLFCPRFGHGPAGSLVEKCSYNAVFRSTRGNAVAEYHISSTRLQSWSMRSSIIMSTRTLPMPSGLSTPRPSRASSPEYATWDRTV